MTDIVAELRRLYEAAPQGKWTLEPYAGFASGSMGYDIRIGPNAGDVIVGADRALLGHDEREIGDLIVAMHEALPALLDAVEALERYVRHLDQGRRHIDNDTALDAWDRQVGQNWDLIEDALAALERSDDQ